MPVKSITELKSLWRREPVLQRGVWGIIDQGFVSATNFTTVVLIARAVSPESFGEYTLAMMSIALVMGVFSAALMQPFSVVSASRRDTDYPAYVTSVFVSQMALVLVASALILGVAGLMALAGWKIALLVALIGPAMAMTQMQEFVRLVMYVDGRILGALINDVVNYGSQLALIVAAAATDALSPVNALAIVALTSGLGFVFGALQVRRELRWPVSRAAIASGNTENWRLGRWILGTTVLMWVSDYGLPFIVAGVVGLVGAAAMRIVYTLFGPVTIMLKAIDASFGPTAAHIVHNEGSDGLNAHLRRIVLITGPIMLAYCGAMALFSEPLLTLVYGDKYDQYAWLLSLAAVSFFLTYAYKPAVLALRALRVPQEIFRTHVWHMGIFLTLGLALIVTLKLPGAGAWLVISSGFVCADLWRRYLKQSGSLPMVPQHDALGSELATEATR